jgi:hypothetical protein
MNVFINYYSINYKGENMYFHEGVMWEDNPFSIEINYTCSDRNDKPPCKHCFDYRDEVYTSCNVSYTRKVWTNPMVVIVENEGGCNSTGLCVQCLLEAVEEMKR